MSGGWFYFDFADFSYAFLSVLLEGVPFILLGTLISGLIDQFLPSRWMTRFLPRNPYLGAAASAGLGMVFPMCECGVVPVIRRLVAKGLPISHAVAYMLAAPVVNPIVAVSTWAAFRGQAAMEMTTLRLGVAWFVATLAGMAVIQLADRTVIKKSVLAPLLTARGGELDTTPGGSLWVRLGRAAQVGLRDFLAVMVYFVLGVAVASIFSTAINQSIIIPLALDVWLATAALMGLSFILSLCSTSDAFIAATFVAFPAVSKLAFLVFGPMIDLKLVFLYSSVFTKRFVLGLTLGLFVLTGLICVRLTVLGL
jgi:uncharacterized membrane protein YraQ (UPF0718 family)